jgi:signal transduction histidine kinase
LVIFNCQFIFYSYLCTVKKTVFLLLAALILLLAGCGREPQADPLLRARADGLNKEAFVNRYRDPDTCLALSRKALKFIADSLPDYADGVLRARNTMAFAYYQMSDAESARKQLDQVDKLRAKRLPSMHNGDIEWVISQLLRARLLQRNCQIADSYQLLYDVGRSGILERKDLGLLGSYARSEYYITMLVLNFHYRNGQEGDVRTLIGEVEAALPDLKVDYAQDMALNYALAYGLQSAGESKRALEYCDRNIKILSMPSAFCTYHYANTVQMAASALKSIPGTASPDSVLALYDTARCAFFDYGDPYQMLGGTTSTARYALLIGDTAKAHSVLREWLDWTKQHRATASVNDPARWSPFKAPKMELGLFDVLLRSRMASTPDEALRWYLRHTDLHTYISRNEHEDFALQQSLATAQRRSSWLTKTVILFGVMAAVLLGLTVLLWFSSRRLRREKQQLEAAKRRDVERIANVETTLSVLRHDVSPFMGYLRNPVLTPEVRDEVLEQLLRTFDNIKNWTRLSIPGGMAFHASRFALQEAFEEVRAQVTRPHADVDLRFEPTTLRLYADRLLVVIMLRNIVGNALKHTAAGSIIVDATATGDGMVDITVRDTGSGMDAAQVESLFRADRTLPEGSEHGFGLILCRYIIKKHDDLTRRGCRIWAESTPGKGTTMHVVLVDGDNGR